MHHLANIAGVRLGSVPFWFTGRVVGGSALVLGRRLSSTAVAACQTLALKCRSSDQRSRCRFFLLGKLGTCPSWTRSDDAIQSVLKKESKTTDLGAPEQGLFFKSIRDYASNRLLTHTSYVKQPTISLQGSKLYCFIVQAACRDLQLIPRSAFQLRQIKTIGLIFQLKQTPSSKFLLFIYLYYNVNSVCYGGLGRRRVLVQNNLVMPAAHQPFSPPKTTLANLSRESLLVWNQNAAPLSNVIPLSYGFTFPCQQARCFGSLHQLGFPFPPPCLLKFRSHSRILHPLIQICPPKISTLYYLPYLCELERHTSQARGCFDCFHSLRLEACASIA